MARHVAAARVMAVLLVLTLLSAIAVSLHAAPGKGKGNAATKAKSTQAKKGPGPGKGHKGKPPIGEIVSFDAGTNVLVVARVDGSEFSGPVADGVQVKIDHRGKPAKKGNPTRGSLDDLVAGHKVLRLKVVDGTATKIKVRRVDVDPPIDTSEDEDD